MTNFKRGTISIEFRDDLPTGRHRWVKYTVAYKTDPTCRTQPEVAALLDRLRPRGWLLRKATPSQALDPVDAFRRFARGLPVRLPWSAETTLYFNGVEVADFNPTQARRLDSWAACPRGSASYEGHRCPISVIRVVRDAGRGSKSTSIEYDAPTVVGCNRVQEPPGIKSEAIGWIRPDQDRDCFGDFAVGVYLDGAEDVSAVNLVLSGP